MSILAALLGWTKLPQWALELLVIGAAVFGVWLWHAHTYHAGIQAQRQADRAVSEKIEAQAAAATEAAQEAANRAEESYREEIASNAATAAIRPLGPVRLCIDAIGRSGLSEAGASDSGNANASAAAGNLQSVLHGDPGVRTKSARDVGSLLNAWAEKADGVSATLREFQERASTH